MLCSMGVRHSCVADQSIRLKTWRTEDKFVCLHRSQDCRFLAYCNGIPLRLWSLPQESMRLSISTITHYLSDTYVRLAHGASPSWMSVCQRGRGGGNIEFKSKDRKVDVRAERDRLANKIDQTIQRTLTACPFYPVKDIALYQKLGAQVFVFFDHMIDKMHPRDPRFDEKAQSLISLIKEVGRVIKHKAKSDANLIQSIALSAPGPLDSKEGKLQKADSLPMIELSPTSLDRLTSDIAKWLTETSSLFGEGPPLTTNQLNEVISYIRTDLERMIAVASVSISGIAPDTISENDARHYLRRASECYRKGDDGNVYLQMISQSPLGWSLRLHEYLKLASESHCDIGQGGLEAFKNLQMTRLQKADVIDVFLFQLEEVKVKALLKRLPPEKIGRLHDHMRNVLDSKQKEDDKYKDSQYIINANVISEYPKNAPEIQAKFKNTSVYIDKILNKPAQFSNTHHAKDTEFDEEQQLHDQVLTTYKTILRGYIKEFTALQASYQGSLRGSGASASIGDIEASLKLLTERLVKIRHQRGEAHDMITNTYAAIRESFLEEQQAHMNVFDLYDKLRRHYQNELQEYHEQELRGHEVVSNAYDVARKEFEARLVSIEEEAQRQSNSQILNRDESDTFEALRQSCRKVITSIGQEEQHQHHTLYQSYKDLQEDCQKKLARLSEAEFSLYDEIFQKYEAERQAYQESIFTTLNKLRLDWEAENAS